MPGVTFQRNPPPFFCFFIHVTMYLPTVSVPSYYYDTRYRTIPILHKKNKINRSWAHHWKNPPLCSTTQPSSAGIVAVRPTMGCRAGPPTARGIGTGRKVLGYKGNWGPVTRTHSRSVLLEKTQRKCLCHRSRLFATTKKISQDITRIS